MQRILIGAALLVCLAHPAIAQDVIGDWQGTLKVGSVELRLVLHIARKSSGALKATLDSVDQGTNGIPVTSMSLSQSKLKFTVESVNGSYEGTLNAAATTVCGTWSQGQPIPYSVHTSSQYGHGPDYVQSRYTI
jgi:hypothetical protein